MTSPAQHDNHGATQSGDRDADAKNASLDMVLKSDTGFRSSSKGDRISVNQWRDVMLVIADAEAYRAMRAAPELLEALKAALIIFDEIDEYQKRPESGSYDAECACCMGELFDNGERDDIAEMRAAIAKALGQ